MEETVPILCMCRLCLNYSQDCCEITVDETNLILRNKIRKYLYVEVKTNADILLLISDDDDFLIQFSFFIAQVDTIFQSIFHFPIKIICLFIDKHR